jgi:uncharacterized membrane protein YagU involved in acid resistance
MRLGLDQSPSQHGQCGMVPGRFPLQDDVVGAFLLHWIFTCTIAVVHTMIAAIWSESYRLIRYQNLS